MVNEDTIHFKHHGFTWVRIEQGELLSGIVDNRTVGTAQQSLIHVLWKDEGATKCMKFINNLNSLMTAFLLTHSSSVGISDCMVDLETLENVDNYISAKDITKAIFEEAINNTMNQATHQIGKCVRKSLPKMNNFKQMADAGSKGKQININQIIGCVGQVNIMGKRVMDGFTQRTF